MSQRIVFVFSGQGSQYYAMGRELYKRHKAFRYHVDHCSAIVEPTLGVWLPHVLFSPPQDRAGDFDRTFYTSPAIFIINYSVAQVLVAEGLSPDLLLGYSLGELTATAFGGYVGLTDMLNFVTESSRILESATPEAGMLAVLSDLSVFENHHREFEGLSVASVNFDQNFVVTGPVVAVKRAKAFLSRNNIISQILPIRRGFHSHMIDCAEGEYRRRFVEMPVAEGSLPVFSCVYLRYLRRADLTDQFYWDVIRRPVNFPRAVRALEAEGPCVFIDVGPSGTLATFVKYILSPGSASGTFSILDPFGNNVRSLEKVLAAYLPVRN